MIDQPCDVPGLKSAVRYGETVGMRWLVNDNQPCVNSVDGTGMFGGSRMTHGTAVAVSPGVSSSDQATARVDRCPVGLPDVDLRCNSGFLLTRSSRATAICGSDQLCLSRIRVGLSEALACPGPSQPWARPGKPGDEANPLARSSGVIVNREGDESHWDASPE